jgi:solute:Na+ symporter, SSS family
VRGRFGNRWLMLAIAITGIVATTPYIALQLVGIQVVLGALGLSGTGLVADLPLIVAFLVLAAFTYSSGLRAPAAIAIGALVPAAIMSIAAASLYTRNIHREFINPNPSDRQESQIAKWVSLLVKLGALIFILFIPTQYAIQLQLLGGVWIIQTLPAVMPGVFTRWFNSWALLAGWAAGIGAGTAMAVTAHLTPTYSLTVGGYTFPGYTALYMLLLNLLLAGVLTPLLNRLSAQRPPFDATVAADYRA